MIHLLWRAIAAWLLAVVLAACDPAPDGPPDGRPFTPGPGSDLTVAAAGDIACPKAACAGQRETADLVARLRPDAVLVLGDNQYERGALSEYSASYDPTWGRFARITHPVPGNHEYRTEGAAGYFDYFRSRAHEAQGGWYSFELERWHLVAINSGDGEVSLEQLSWVRDDLAADERRCELAFWHHPMWSSGAVLGSDPIPVLDALWATLFDAGVDVALNGHAHSYERFTPLNQAGLADPRGIREFVVGTGGRSFHPFDEPDPGSERRITNVYGVLELTLHERAYAWRFVGTGGRVLDEGVGTCHP